MLLILVYLKISILTGGPGTGKTSTVIKNICQILKKQKRIIFLAPTHAAKNRGYEEIILKNVNKEIDLENNIKFSTLQSSIFMYDLHSEKTNNISKYVTEYDYIIIDEMSMVKSEDLDLLLDSISNSDCSLLLVGDKDQLPPIGMGNPFKDLIDSNKIPICYLTYNFRAKD